MSRHDRAAGALVGMAVADALGAPVEFDSPDAIAHRRAEVEAFPGGGTFGWDPGEFTDDTQMAIVLARHLASGPLDQDALAGEFAAWAAHPLTADVGNQTRAVLGAVRRGVAWRDAVAALPPDAAGNGSLMRAAPVAIVAHDADAARRLAEAQSEVTHPNAWCVDACGVFAVALHAAIERGALPAPNALAAGARTIEVAAAVRRAADPAPPRMSGFVLDTLGGALWAVHHAPTFADAAWAAVALGRDADTVAAVAGALAGALHGLDAIPADWRARLTTKHPLFAGRYPDALETLARALGDRAGS